MIQLRPLLLGAALAAAPFFVSTAAALLGEVPTLEAVRLEVGERIRLDGVLDEHAWQRAKVAAGFRQQEPREGE